MALFNAIAKAKRDEAATNIKTTKETDSVEIENNTNKLKNSNSNNGNKRKESNREDSDEESDVKSNIKESNNSVSGGKKWAALRDDYMVGKTLSVKVNNDLMCYLPVQ